VVVVEGEADLLGVERDRAVDVGDGNADEFDPGVHASKVGAIQVRP
jgi:hypothetical protein